MLPAQKPVASPVEPAERAPKNLGEVAGFGPAIQWTSSPASPARAMQDHLAQRLNGDADAGRPAPLTRLIIILGASAALWVIIGTATIAVLN